VADLGGRGRGREESRATAGREESRATAMKGLGFRV
jgi:hypothetical protein